MKFHVVLALLAVLIPAYLKSQEAGIKGKPVLELFTDFHQKLGAIEGKTTGFGINRAYFGYTYSFAENWSASMTLDIAAPEDLAPGAKPRRFAHFREASFSYTGERLKLSMGITSTTIFMYQQRFWGKRYLAKPYQSLNGYGFIADIGIVGEMKINDFISADFSFMNGKGYSNPQIDDNLKSSIGITLIPAKVLSIRAYADIMDMYGVWQTTLVGFAGVKTKVFYAGGEFSYKSNLDLEQGHHAWGFSSTAGIFLSEKAEFFARFDYSTSVLVPGNILKWNYLKDGTFIITGLQYSLNNYVKLALNYQSLMPYDTRTETEDFVLLNALVRF